MLERNIRVFFCFCHYSLQGITAGNCPVPRPDSDGSSVVSLVGCFFSLHREWRCCWALWMRAVMSMDHFRSPVMCTQELSCWPSPATVPFPKINNHLLRLLHIHRAAIVAIASSQLLHLLSVMLSLWWDPPQLRHLSLRCEWSRISQCSHLSEEEWAEHTALRTPGTKCDT